MPTYEYSCAKCGEFEEFQKISAPPLKKCPECGGKVRRLVSGGSTFILSGKNWISKLPTPKDDMAKIKERILKRTVLDEAEETPKIPPHRYHGRRSTN